MLKEKRLEIRLSDDDFARLEAYANHKDVSMAQVLREYIKRLPKPQVRTP
jgi:predicted DNA-binding protein